MAPPAAPASPTPATRERAAPAGAAAAASPASPPADTPERRRVRSRLLDQFRLVKNRPDRPVHFLLCVGRTQAAAWLHPGPVSESQKPLLLKALKGDTGFKWYRGQCLWEDGAYTFVGPRLNALIARRLIDGFAKLSHGTKYRIRARE